MKRMLFVLFVAVAALLVASCSQAAPTQTQATSQTSASTQTYTMRVAHSYATTVLHHWTVENFKKLIEKETNGRLKVEIYPASQLYRINEEVQGVLTGSIEACYTIPSTAAAVVPSYEVSWLPFLFAPDANIDSHIYKWIHSDKGGMEVDKRLQAKGLKMLFTVPTTSPMYIIGNNVREIKTITDSKGLKIRTTGSWVQTEYLKAINASPVTMAWAEIAAGLQQKVVDGMTSALSFQYDSKMMTKYVTLEPSWGFTLQPMLVNLKWFNGLPSDIQQALLKVVRGCEEYNYTEAWKGHLAALEGAKKEGTIFTNLSAEESVKFKQACAPVSDEFIKKFPESQSLVDEAKRLDPRK